MSAVTSGYSDTLFHYFNEGIDACDAGSLEAFLKKSGMAVKKRQNDRREVLQVF
jgi:hypothetical protein